MIRINLYNYIAILSYIISYHIILYHLISYHIISCYDYVTLCQLMISYIVLQSLKTLKSAKSSFKYHSSREISVENENDLDTSKLLKCIQYHQNSQDKKYAFDKALPDDKYRVKEEEVIPNTEYVEFKKTGIMKE